MSAASQLEDPTTPWVSEDPLVQLSGQLADLLVIQHQLTYGLSQPESHSTFLHSFQYVCGEKSVEKSFMRFNVNLSPVEEAGDLAEETFTLELSVRRRRQYAR